jgi:AraC family transcriptional regulator
MARYRLFSSRVSVSAKALWYIESHLSGELSLEEIAGAVEVSRFHLSRAFAVSTGNSLAGYVRARRLTEAAKALVQGAPDILTVALESGYGSHEAFTRAFRQHFGLTPEQLRAQARFEETTLQEPIRMDKTITTPLASPRIVKSDEILIFGLGEHYIQSNAGMPAQWNRFLPYLGQIPGQIGNVAYGVICNCDEAGACDYICGVAVKEFPSHPPEFKRLRIPPQSYAVFEHRDHISAIAGTWKAIWECGLANAGYQAADGPSFERYDEHFDGRTGLGGLEIWVPIKS